MSPNDPALAFTVADAVPPARSRFRSSARNRRSISPTSADMAREYRWAPDMITILSIEGGFDENVGNEVFVPERKLAADSSRISAHCSKYRLREADARKRCGHDCKTKALFGVLGFSDAKRLPVKE
jgi:hypothetical protein